MSNNVVTLSEVKRPQSTSAIELLKELLELAEKGEILDVAVASLKPGGLTAFAWNSGDNGHFMLAAIADLQWEFCKHRGELRMEQPK